MAIPWLCGCEQTPWPMANRLYCSPARYSRTATTAALQAGLDPVKVLAGCRERPVVAVRWTVWRDLFAQGCSYKSIASAAGFDHSSVMHGIGVGRGPYPNAICA